MTHNLLDDPWVSVVTAAGVQEWSLRDALCRASDVVRLDSARPLEWTSIFRLLLAIVTDAHRDGLDWAGIWRQGHFDEQRITAYLDGVRHRFDLLDPVVPFYQVANLESAGGGVKSTLLLYPEVATGNNVPLFSSLLESDGLTLDLASATRRLLALQSYDTAGLKTGAKGDREMSAGKTTGNPVGPLGQIGVVIPLGKNLFESLMLSVPLNPPAPDDLPVWRREPQVSTWQTRPSTGILDLLTWQSRRMRLFTSEVAGERQVTGVVVTAGDRLAGIHPHQEPHTAWRAVDASKGGMSHRPIRHQPGRSAWRGMDALLSGNDSESGPLALRWCREREAELGPDYVLDVRTVGVVYGNQSAVIEHVVFDAVPLAVLALNAQEGILVREVLDRMVSAAEDVRHALNNLDDNLRRARGGEPRPWDKSQRPGEQYIALLDEPTQQFLKDLPGRLSDPFGALADWDRMALDLAWTVADQMLDESGPAAFAGRRAGSSRMNQATAEAYFRGALRKALPDVYEKGLRGDGNQ